MDGLLFCIKKATKKIFLWFVLRIRTQTQNHAEACMKSAAGGMESRRRSEWNHHEVMYGINPKEKHTLSRDAIRLRRLHTHLR